MERITMIVTEPPPPYSAEKILTKEQERERAFNIYSPPTEMKPIMYTDNKSHLININTGKFQT